MEGVHYDIKKQENTLQRLDLRMAFRKKGIY